LKQQFAAGWLRTRAPVRQAPRAYGAASTHPIVGPARPRHPAVPRPGHAPTPRGRRIPPVPHAGQPSRHHGRRPRAAPLGIAVVEDPASEASPGTPTSSSSFRRRSAKNRKSTSRRVLSGECRRRPEPDRRPLLFSGRLCGPSLLPLEGRLISLNPTVPPPACQAAPALAAGNRSECPGTPRRRRPSGPS
jgi:hypothetical protein